MATMGKRDHPTNKTGEKLAIRKLLRHFRYLTRRQQSGKVTCEVIIVNGVFEAAEGGTRNREVLPRVP